MGLSHFSFLHDFRLLKGKMNSSIYGLLAKFTVYAKCFESSIKSSAHSLCDMAPN